MAVTNGFFRKDEFRYYAAQDAYICPGGHELKPIRQGRLRDNYANARACRDCPLRPRCTNNYRSVSRLENEDALDRMEERIAARPDLLDRRREIIEHPFGTIKHWMNQGAFLMRGLEKVRAEFSLTALVYNLRRALNLLGVSNPCRHIGQILDTRSILFHILVILGLFLCGRPIEMRCEVA